MRNIILLLMLMIISSTSTAGTSDSEIEQIRSELKQLKEIYKNKIKSLEKRLQKAEKSLKKGALATQRVESTMRRQQQTQVVKSQNSFNPAMSVILDSTYANYDLNPNLAVIPGFQLGGEAGLQSEGFSLGHTELVLSANIDDLFYGKLTYALIAEDGTTAIELEEAFFETIGLGDGWSIKAGRFFSDIGYLNSKHGHSWDFVDMPLVYRAMMGGNYFDDGLQVSWLAPFEVYSRFGIELLRGDSFPAGEALSNEFAVWTAFAKFGGDWGQSHSWQSGLSFWEADVNNRQGGGHQHGQAATEVATFTGASSVGILDFVYKWSPNGNAAEENLKLQFEYFWRDEDGLINMLGSSPLETTSYQGNQNGFYIQSIYQFKPRWRLGLRYDQLDSDNQGGDVDILQEAGLVSRHRDLQRWTVMMDWSHSEFSRFRLQYSQDEASGQTDQQIYLQYIMSLGSHGGHSF